MPHTKKYLGLELGGSKSARTAIVVLAFYPKEGKVFLSALHNRVQATKFESADDNLLELLNSIAPERVGVNAPLSLAPCVTCKLRCPSFENCKVSAVVWMREEAKREKLSGVKLPVPYTQRPSDVALRGRWRRHYGEIPLEDTMGAGRAPLAARMQYLARQIKCKNLLEVNPRLALVALAQYFDISVRELRKYREVEEGIEQRMLILEKLTTRSRFNKHPSLFLYNADMISIAKNISAFDALLCALMALFAEMQLLEEPEFNPEWGMLAIPRKARETELR